MAESKGRIYVVQEVVENAEPIERLVRAGTGGSAIRHVAVGRFSAAPAKPDDIVRLMSEGKLVQEAGSE